MSRTSLARTGLTALTIAVAPLAAAGCNSDASQDSSSPVEPQPTEDDPVASARPLEIVDGRGNTWTAPDGTEVAFVAVLPPARVAGEPGRVLLAFPPGGQDLDLTERLVEEDWRAEALARGWIVVSPAAPSTGLWYTDETAALLPDFLDSIAATFPPADGTFDLAGVSNGGLSGFRAALEHPERFRSMVLFPGSPSSDTTDEQFAALDEIDITLIVGGDDASWLQGSQQAHDRLAALGIESELVIVPGEGHIIESLTPAQLWDALDP